MAICGYHNECKQRKIPDCTKDEIEPYCIYKILTCILHVCSVSYDPFLTEEKIVMDRHYSG